MSEPAPDVPTGLISHRDAMRRLVRSLVREDQADDVVQDAYLASIESPPRPGWDPRRWVSGVACHLARRTVRAEGRRRMREAATARPEATADPAAIRSQVEQLRQVVDAVLELDPASQQIVTLRYFRDLPPRKIATKLALPVETVKTRLKRALARLRARLDAQHDGDRRAWMVVVAPFALPAPGIAAAAMTAATAAGGFVVKHQIAAAILVVSGAVGAWYITSDGSSNSSRPSVQEEKVVADAQRDGKRTPDPDPAPVHSTRFTPLENEPAAGGDLTPWTVTGIVRYESGRVVPGAEVVLAFGDRVERTRSDSEGHYTVSAGRDAAPARLDVVISGHRISYHDRLPIHPAPTSAIRTWDIVLPDPCIVHGRVLDPQGAVMSAVGLTLRGSSAGITTQSALVLSNPYGKFVLEVPFVGAHALLTMPRLNPDASALGLARTRRATLTREGAPEDRPLWFRVRPRERTRAAERWPFTPQRPVNLVRKERIDVGTLIVGAQGRVEFEVIDVDRGLPVADAEIAMPCPVRGAYVVSTPTDRAGHTRLPWVPGSHRLEPEVIGWALTPESRTVPVMLEPGRSSAVTLRVTRRRTQGVIRHARRVVVSVRDAHNETIAGARVTWGGQERITDQQGEAAFATVRDERHDLGIRRTGFRPLTRADYLLTEQTRYFTLVSVARATLRITDPDGFPVDDVTIGMLGPEHVTYAVPRHSRQPHGDHAVEPVQPNARFSAMVVRGRSGGFKRIDFPDGLLSGQVVEVRLDPTAWTEGRLETPAGEPVANATVFTGTVGLPIDLRHRREPTASGASRYWVGAVRTDARGRFRVLAPARAGVLCVLAGDRGGALLAYESSSGLQRVVVQPAPKILARRTTPGEVDQNVRLFLREPAVRYWGRAIWKADSASTLAKVELRGAYTAVVSPTVDGQGRWRGRRLEGRFEVRGGAITVDL